MTEAVEAEKEAMPARIHTVEARPHTVEVEKPAIVPALAEPDELQELR
jgi:hypothetical protein